jgi:predicted RNA-binding protein with TRAM domain
MLLLGQFASSQNPPEKTLDPPNLAEHVMDMHVAFTQPVPAGISIEAKEVSRTGSGKDLVVQYQIFVQGVSPDTRFQSVTWPTTQEEPSPIMGASPWARMEF